MTAAQQRMGPDRDSNPPLLSRLGWLALTVLVGVLLSLVAAWASEMKGADRRNESDIRALEQHMGRLEVSLERMDGKLDILIQREARRK